MSNVRDIDKGWKKHKRMLRLQAGRIPHVNVGVVGPDADEAHEDSDLTVIEVASFHEFGRGNNPERSFIRGNFDANETKYIANMRLFQDQVLSFRLTQKRALKLFGEMVVADMKNFMADGIGEEKVDGTPARLKDTGQLYGSLAYEVKEA